MLSARRQPSPVPVGQKIIPFPRIMASPESRPRPSLSDIVPGGWHWSPLLASPPSDGGTENGHYISRGDHQELKLSDSLKEFDRDIKKANKFFCGG